MDSDMLKLSVSEYQLMEILWKEGNMEATELTSICLERFDWKKSTVYTMLKRLGDKGALVFENKMAAFCRIENYLRKMLRN